MPHQIEISAVGMSSFASCQKKPPSSMTCSRAVILKSRRKGTDMAVFVKNSSRICCVLERLVAVFSTVSGETYMRNTFCSLI